MKKSLFAAVLISASLSLGSCSKSSGSDSDSHCFEFYDQSYNIVDERCNMSIKEADRHAKNNGWKRSTPR